MKPLFDQNLSHRLVALLADVFPHAEHVRNVGLAAADDVDLWDFAAANGFVIVSKDADFHQRSFVLGHPPKVVWIRRGNCSTADVEFLLRSHVGDLQTFEADDESSFLALS